MKKFKVFAAALAICAVSVTAGGCSDNNKVGKWFDQLFCTHEWDDGEVVKEATCASKGEIKYTCESCEKTKTKKTDKLPHTEVEIELEATCTEEGLTDGVKCAVCEEVLQQPKVVAKIPHFEVPNSEAVAATCTTAGLKPGTHCARCDEVISTEMVIPATGHTDEDGNLFCDECNIEITETMDMTEVAVEVGEKVVGNWYRLYKTSDWSQIFFDEVNVGFFANANEDDTRGYVKDPVNNLPFYNLVGFKIVETDEYIDLYFEEGTYEFIKVDGSETEWTFVVDDSLVVSRLNGSVYRLV